MISGVNNYWVRVEKKTRDKNVLGTPTENWTLVREQWAGMLWTGGREYSDQFGNSVEIDVIFSVNYREDWDYKHRFYYKGQYFKIEYIEPVENKKSMRIKCTNWKTESL